jgi:hypothetical protein
VLAAFGELLCRLADRRDLVVGAPVADRRHAAFQDLIGFFVDIVPLRLGAPGDRSFAEHVLAARDELLDGLAHSSTPLDDVVEALALPRDASRGALVQVLFNVYNFAQSCLELPGIAAEQVPAGLPGAPFDLTAYLVERAGRFRIEFVYNPDLYAAERIDALLAGLVHLLGELVAAPREPVRAAGLPQLPRLRSGLTGGEPQVGAEPLPGGGSVGGAEPMTDRESPSGAEPLSGGGSVGGAEPMTDRESPSGAEPRPGGEPAGPGADRATERIIAEVWRAVLRRPTVSRTDNFFDLGGKSLDLVTVAERLAGPLGRELRVVDLFRYPSIRALAAFVDGAAGGGAVQQAAERGAARRERARRRSQQPRPTGPGGRA